MVMEHRLQLMGVGMWGNSKIGNIMVMVQKLYVMEVILEGNGTMGVLGMEHHTTKVENSISGW